MPFSSGSLVSTSNIIVLSASATLIAAANANRKALIIRNIGTGSGQTVYIGDSAVTVGVGLPLNNGTGSSKMGDVLTIEDATAAVYGRVASGTQDVRVLEVHD